MIMTRKAITVTAIDVSIRLVTNLIIETYVYETVQCWSQPPLVTNLFVQLQERQYAFEGNY